MRHRTHTTCHLTAPQLIVFYSFELWEIAWTESYWTAAVEVHALRSAAILGRKIGRDYEVKGWESTASVILSFMQVRRNFAKFVSRFR